MTIKKWQEEIHKNAKEKGWHDGPKRKPLEFHMLMVSEIAEASEEVRNGKAPFYKKGRIEDYGNSKPEGEAVELADCVIRIMDLFEYRGWDLEEIMTIKHDYNKTRPYRHGGKTV
jgi:hypothetical protein